MGVASMLCSALLLAAFQYPASMDRSAWAEDPEKDPLEALQDIFRYGIAVDQFHADGKTCSITFCTSLPPPYLVGVYMAANAAFHPWPSTRSRPLCYKIVEGRNAVISYDFASLKANAFVQVMPAVWTNYPGFRVMSQEEIDQHYATLAHDVLDWDRPDVGDGEQTWLPLPLWRWASQEVPIRPRTVKSLSVRDGKRIGLDWQGTLRVIKDEEAEPNRIYWEGRK